MLRRVTCFALLLLILPALGLAEEVACPIKLEQSQMQTLIVATSRDATEQQLAKALRANRELSALYDQTAKQVKQLTAELEKAKAEKVKPEESKQP